MLTIKKESIFNTMADGNDKKEITVRAPSKVPEFGAPGSTLTAEAWVDTITGLAAGGNWTDAATAGQASAVLVGKAAEWRRMMLTDDNSELTSWITFKKAFLARFGANRGTTTDTAVLLNLQQRPQEDAGDFGDRCFNNILTICARVRNTIEEADNKNYFDLCRSHITMSLFMNGLRQPTRSMLNARHEEKDGFRATVALAMQIEDSARREDRAISEISETEEHDVAAFQQSGFRGRGRGRGRFQPNQFGRSQNFTRYQGPASNQRPQFQRQGGRGRPFTGGAQQSRFSTRPWIYCWRCRTWGKHYSYECKRNSAEMSSISPQDENTPPDVDPQGLTEAPEN